ncbi:MAG: DUF47 family protein [Coriobacteriales bacterium]|jgi:uncharacterized protein Yka (UPF0111/DUF47 family)|nr:DUF47 family protein [Coriobacteriales bacterium]
MAKIRFNYFDAFEHIAQCACREARMLNEIMTDFSHADLPEQLVKMHEIENEADSENHQIYRHLANEFVPPIEREDIVTLAQNLDNIVDYIEGVAQRLYMFDIKEIPEPALQMGVLIEKSSVALAEAIKDFRNFKKSKTLDQLLITVNDSEEEADKIYFNAVRDIFVECKDSPLYVMTWYDLLVGMERCVDATENAASTVSTIIMKNT